MRAYIDDTTVGYFEVVTETSTYVLKLFRADDRKLCRQAGYLGQPFGGVDRAPADLRHDWEWVEVREVVLCRQGLPAQFVIWIPEADRESYVGTIRATTTVREIREIEVEA